MPEYLAPETPEPKVNNSEEDKLVRLLEEELLVDSSKHKIGEVIVRKAIETKMVQVPVRREKLIVEQITPDHKQLAEIDLSQGEITGVELRESDRPEFNGQLSGLTVNGRFVSPKIASLLLNAIALERNHGCQEVVVSISVDNEEYQKKYQEWFDRCSQGQLPKPEK
ncbi:MULTISPECIES: DUF2382 domain-containing protein [unclassified Anabaena]|uniref:DUF2382 domain-containing protein n=1 Tax=unclassified Anabaena TaxID=2619674 RepID=UPI00082C29A0|nr:MULTISPECIES: DUF2382 domain-containing protein [unclassified Anabaena]